MYTGYFMLMFMFMLMIMIMIMFMQGRDNNIERFLVILNISKCLFNFILFAFKLLQFTLGICDQLLFINNIDSISSHTLNGFTFSLNHFFSDLLFLFDRCFWLF